MSGTKLTCLMLCCLHCTFLSAITWNIERDVYASRYPNPIHYALAPYSFPDSLCVLSGWSPVYHGFGIHEGLLYIGSSKFDLSLKSQTHPSMSNHQLSLGFPVLSGSQISAGIQFHYSCSFIYDLDTKHKLSVSGGFNLQPEKHWMISFYSFHILQVPQDSCAGLSDSRIGASTSIEMFKGFELSLNIQKYRGISWDPALAMFFKPLSVMTCSAKYKLNSQELSLTCQLKIHQWCFMFSFSYHEYLGLNEKIVIAYEK